MRKTEKVLSLYVMRIRLFSYLMATLLACSCARQGTDRDLSPMLRAVPSDAVVVASYDHAGGMLESLLPEGDVLRKLDLGSLARRKATLSYCYARNLTALLAIDAGKSASDSLSKVSRLIRQADSLGLHPCLSKSSPNDMRTILLMSRSQTLIDEALRHLDEGSSIFDADGFEASALRASSDDILIFRNQAASRWFPSVKGPVERKKCVTLMRKLADWTVLSDRGNGCFELAFEPEASAPCFSTLLATLAEDPLKVYEAVGDSVDFCISIAAGQEKFRPAYEQWLDATMALTSYRRTLESLRKQSSKDPLSWEKEQDIREVALTLIGGEPVCLTRHGRKSVDGEVMENPYRGFLPALYGNIFSCDDAFCCRRGSWTAYGVADAVQEWADAGIHQSELKPYSFLYRRGAFSVHGDKKRVLLWNINQ